MADSRYRREAEDDAEAAQDAMMTEEAPLLRVDGEDEPKHLYRQNTTILAFVAIFLFELAVGIMTPAINAMMEDIICQDYYSVVGDPLSLTGDPRCKAPEIQGRLATLRGWQTTVEAVPAILCAIPFGILADRIGRKPVMLLGIIGVLLNFIWMDIVFFFSNIFPAWTVLLSAVFLFIGGFPAVGPAMLYTILADVTPQAERATVYFGLNGAFLVAELLASPIGGLLLEVHAWVALLVGLGLAFLAGLALLPMPETLDLIKKIDEQNGEAEVPDAATREEEPRKVGLWRRTVRLVKDNAADTWTFILGNRRIVLLMFPIMFFVVGRFVQELLLQYATKRYDISWSKAAYLLTIRSTANLVLNLAILPAVSTLCLKRLHLSALSKDLWIARISGVALIIGSLMIAASVTPVMLSFALVVFSMGCGFAAVVRSLLNAFVEPHHQAILNSLLALLQNVGLMIAGPVLFEGLRIGINLGGGWIGLPFVMAAFCGAVATPIVFVFRLPPGDGSS